MFNRRVKYSVVRGGKAKVWIAEAAEEQVSSSDVKVLHDIVIVFGGEEGIVNEGLVNIALYDAWFKSKGNPVEYSALTYYNLILNHPFVNGNKRTATLTAYTILCVNSYELKASDRELVDLALKVANGKVDKNYVVKWFRNRSIKVSIGNNVKTIKLPKNPEKRKKVLEKIAWKIIKKRRKAFEELAKY